MFITKIRKFLPVQAVPVYPLAHAHCDDEHTVLAIPSVHCESNAHPMPTTAETDMGTSEVYSKKSHQ